MVHPFVDPVAHTPHQSQCPSVVQHAGSPQGVGPHVLNVIDQRNTAHPTDQAGRDAHRQRRVICVHHIRTLGHEQAVHQGRTSKADVIQHPFNGRLIVVGVQRQSRDLPAATAFALQRLDLVARIHFATRVVREARHHLHIKALSNQLTRKHQALKSRLGVKPLRQQQHTGFFGGDQYFFQTTRFT